jgi:integrase
MKLVEKKKHVFVKVGECLYRYKPTGGYYARIKKPGKEIRQSLETTDRALAKRKLADLQRDLARIDLAAGKMTLAELCDRYLLTVAHQKSKTVERKQAIVKRVKENWPGGATIQISKVVPSQIQTWLACYKFGPPSYNLYLECIRAIFQLAVDDRLIATSPAAGMEGLKREKPIRDTPSFDEFKKIVTEIRNQRLNADAKESADFIEFLGLAGLGQAEAAALKWGDINWSKQQITTFRHKTGQGFVFPLYPQVRPLLERLRGSREPAPGEFVFKIKDARKALGNACTRLKLTHYSHRALRRMFITRAIEKGVDVKVIAQWQGHQDGGKLILNTYSHVRREHDERMAQLMALED